MGNFIKWSKISGLAALFSLTALLSACILSAGAFVSQLDIRSDRSFTYSYQGEIYMLALGKLAQMANKEQAGFTPEPCYDEQDEPRSCSAAEVEEQRQEWETRRQPASRPDDGEAQAMQAMLGGIDPSDPEAAKELADRLSRQKGWHKVEYVGDGLFNVDFSISGYLGHDFVFPTMEQFPMPNHFLMANLRENGAVRIDAPGFAAQTSTNPMQSMMGGMASAMSAKAQSDADASQAPSIPELQGRFTIVTDGQILANNTDEGVRIAGEDRVLEWFVTSRTQSAPMALIQLGN